jgi:lysyl-tRNA synthetase class 2
VNPHVRETFRKRTQLTNSMREFLNNRSYMEVETPILQPLYGGAAARPFKTQHNKLDMTLYLRIANELYLKRLIVGGFEKVYEIAKNFRNEGIDRSHNPEFTMLEWYEAYTDYMYQLKQFEDLVAHLALTVTGSYKVEYQGKTVDFTPPWRKLTVYDGIRQYAQVDPEKISSEDLVKELKKRKIEIEWDKKTDRPVQNRAELLMELFEATVEEHLWDPTFIMDHPVEISPLTKKHRTSQGLVERFEPFAAGMEIGNAYSELNDPEEQYERLKEQESKRLVDEEAQPMDEDFMHAIDTGMPPTGGVGLGIERIVMILTNQASIRDIILFPTMKIIK